MARDGGPAWAFSDGRDEAGANRRTAWSAPGGEGRRPLKVRRATELRRERRMLTQGKKGSNDYLNEIAVSPAP